MDQKEAQTEWVLRPYMNTTKKREFIGEKSKSDDEKRKFIGKKPKIIGDE